MSSLNFENRPLLEQEREQDNPQFLCRYRTVSSSTLEALQAGKLYFSSPCFFNDPFDSVAYIDEEKLIRSISAQIEYGITSGYVPKSSIVPFPDDFAKLLLKQFNDTRRRAEFLSEVKEAAQNLKKCISKNTKVICFSELYLSSLMWAHYANEHKGFELIYDYEALKNAEVYNAANNKLSENTILQEVKYYQQMPDQGLLFFDELPYQMYPFKRRRVDGSFYRRLLFSKGKEWDYEKEWRLCAAGEDILTENPAKYISVDPVAVFLGARMSEEDRKRVFLAAKGKRIEFFDVLLDESNSRQALQIKKAAHMIESQDIS